MNHEPYIILIDDAPDSPAASDCNCACPQTQPLSARPALPAASVIERHPLLQSLPLDGAHQTIFVPSLSRVAVVNAATEGLLERLRTPTPLAALAPAEEAAARVLFAGGLTREHGVADTPPDPPDELIAWLHVTNACNLRCTYCYLEKTNEAMEAETALAAVEAVLRSAMLNGYRRVLLKYAGGEASLNMAQVEVMHRYAQSQAAEHGLTLDGVILSNGVGLTQVKLERIASLGLRLMISLDGPEAVHDAQRPTVGGKGSHRFARQSALAARARGIPLNLSITVTGASAAGLPEVVGWALANDLRFAINFYRENDCSAIYTDLRLDEQRIIDGMRAAYAVIEANLPSYSLLGCLLDRANLGGAHGRTCAVGENYLVIDQHGAVAKCQMEITRPVSNIWAKNPLHAIRLDQMGVQNLHVDAKEGCRSCEWRYWCTGGCAVATFRATGRYDVRSPNCAIYKALYPDVLRLEGLRLLAHRPFPPQPGPSLLVR